MRNGNFDLDPLSHCFIYSLGVLDLNICNLVDEKKDFVFCSSQCRDLVYSLFLVFLSTLPAVLCIFLVVYS